MEITVSADGTLVWPGGRLRCALGRGGVRADKREGDGATPVGVFPLRRLLVRRDRLPEPHVPPVTGLPLVEIGPDDGWCDDPADPAYNRPVRLPFTAGHERLWRDDGLYDLVVVLGHNDEPPRPGLGSAIFLHLARPDYAPTEGCVALERGDLLRLLADCDGATVLRVEAPTGLAAPAAPGGRPGC
jgi:L,D-peptidoglycan transpeptidase YkuD (ErfK/YbiS/YcfS/YnhG family)